MLKVVKAKTLDDLIQETLPANLPKNDLPEWPALTETEALARIQQYADKNIIAKNFVGGGYYGTIVPNVILRNLLECPQWYTSYTPY